MAETKSPGFHTADPAWYNLLKDCKKENRKKPTEAENALWELLKGKSLGVKFRRQHIIGDYIVDFVALSKQLVIEVDGGYHDNPAQMEWDLQRTAFLEGQGFKVIRFRNEEILFDTDYIVNKIISFIKN